MLKEKGDDFFVRFKPWVSKFPGVLLLLPAGLSQLANSTLTNIALQQFAICGVLLHYTAGAVLYAIVAIAGVTSAGMLANAIANYQMIGNTLRHVRRHAGCIFDLVSNEQLSKKMGMSVPYLLVSDPIEVNSFFNIVYHSAPTEQGAQSPNRGAKSGWLQYLYAIRGYHFLIRTQRTLEARGPTGFYAFLGTDYRFVFFNSQPRGWTPLQIFRLVHELGHAEQPSMSMHFRTSGFSRILFVLPVIAVAVTLDQFALLVVSALPAYIVYLLFIHYPPRLHIGYLRDEMGADRFAVWNTPVEALRQITDEMLKAFVRRDHNLPPRPSDSMGKDSLYTAERYRFQALQDERNDRLTGKPEPRWSSKAPTTNRNGMQMRGIAHYAEGLIGLAVLWLGVFRFELNDYSLAIAFCYVGAMSAVATALAFGTRRRWLAIAGFLQPASIESRSVAAVDST